MTDTYYDASTYGPEGKTLSSGLSRLGLLGFLQDPPEPLSEIYVTEWLGDGSADDEIIQQMNADEWLYLHAPAPKLKSLTAMQKRYVWIAGSFPKHVLVQGRGKRTSKTFYAIEEDRVYVFGYSDPLNALRKHGIFERLQDGRAHCLTDAGQKLFKKMLVSGVGGRINQEIKEAQLARSA